ncbi:LytR/AlgR family response regulator transcription factor [Hymenobacter yonginensis]|uniref:LytTR family DNA-binding domain-containing protein n=1 Tax=Hymenobacter yonginensis TaxID=748197 RepID=A0ABY7PN65_9BACT|nr:LytTR family DNA-binding domain-containing protein [Hymenobacter yonginensis]WBO84695.1 LytTR family DNA-binding domain-containing protein [Hymenobacter yonginensis]
MNAAAPLRCLLVDDEPLAHTVLHAYLDRLPGLATWAGSCYGAVEALTLLRTTPVDVLFLDVDMPELTGLELLRALPQPPQVVLCTAHATHALEAFDLGVVDYLLKPIRFERFVKTVTRLHTLLAERSPSPTPAAPASPPAAASPAPDSFFLKTDAGTERVRFSELLYVEGYGNFVKCHTAAGRTLLTAETMKQMESSLPATQFLRVHKSYLVNMTCVERLSGNSLHVGGREVPVGSTFRTDVLRRLQLR